MKIAALIACALPLAGCASMDGLTGPRQKASAGLVGCPSDEVAVTEEKPYTWTATCRGRVFYCTAIAAQPACKEALKPAGG